MRDLREFGFRLAAGLGLGVSLALLWAYTRSAPALCTPGGACDVVRESDYAALAGIPTPLFGVLFFGAALLVSALPGPRARNLLAMWSAGGAAVAAALLIIQGTVIDAFCVACVVADAAALVMLPLAIVGRRAPDYPRPRRLAATAAAAALAAVPLGYGMLQTGPDRAPSDATVDTLPPPIAEAQVDDKVTIVEFLDFTCPFCRQLHHELKEILPDYEDEVAVARMYVPSPQNEIAQLAALAAICAEGRGIGEDMNHELFAVEQLGGQTVMGIVSELGITQDELASCVTSPETRARLEADFEAARDIELQGLPTVFIGRERYDGAQSAADLRAAIERAIDRGDHEL